MHYKKFRWSQVYESSEEELLDFMQARGIEGVRIHADEELPEQRTDADARFWCAEGSLIIKTATANISLQPGDAIRIEAGTSYTIQPGIADCVYYLSA